MLPADLREDVETVNRCLESILEWMKLNLILIKQKCYWYGVNVWSRKWLSSVLDEVAELVFSLVMLQDLDLRYDKQVTEVTRGAFYQL